MPGELIGSIGVSLGGAALVLAPTPLKLDADVLGINLGITVLSAENLRSGRIWRWFMANPEVGRALRLAGVVPVTARG